MTEERHSWCLDRPLAVFDLETTGISPRVDRIIELAVVKLCPDGSMSTYCRRVNPGIPIPPETTRIHGITDEDVAGCPPFKDLAAEIFELLEGCDLAGYNVARFDIPMLAEEFLRAGFDFDGPYRRAVDAQRIFHRREPRDLAAALRYYCDEEHEDAHGAEADARATLRVLEGQFRMYEDLPRDVASLDQYCSTRRPEWVDRTGKLKWQNGEVILNFSRRKGEALRSIIESDRGFVKWMLASDLPRDMRDIVQEATEGRWPKPPEGVASDQRADD